MVIASIILGILFIIAGFYCMAAPISTFFNVMMMFAAMMFVFGIFGIVRYFKHRAIMPELITSILAVIIGFVYLFRPGTTGADGLMMLDRVVLFLAAMWFLIKGSLTVYYAFHTRLFNNHWILQMIAGFLSIILGIYSFIFPEIAAQNIGILIGLWYLECGIELIALGATAGFVQRAVDDARQEVEETVKEMDRAARQYNKELRDRINAAEEQVKEIPIETPDSAASKAAAEPEVIDVPVKTVSSEDASEAGDPEKAE